MTLQMGPGRAGSSVVPRTSTPSSPADNTTSSPLPMKLFYMARASEKRLVQPRLLLLQSVLVRWASEHVPIDTLAPRLRSHPTQRPTRPRPEPAQRLLRSEGR